MNFLMTNPNENVLAQLELLKDSTQSSWPCPHTLFNRLLTRRLTSNMSGAPATTKASWRQSR